MACRVLSFIILMTGWATLGKPYRIDAIGGHFQAANRLAVQPIRNARRRNVGRSTALVDDAGCQNQETATGGTVDGARRNDSHRLCWRSQTRTGWFKYLLLINQSSSLQVALERRMSLYNSGLRQSRERSSFRPTGTTCCNKRKNRAGLLL